MKNKCFLLIFFFITLNCFSQKKGVVKYSISFGKVKFSEKMKKSVAFDYFNSMISQYQKNSKNRNFILSIDGDKSSFTIDPLLDLSKEGLNSIEFGDNIYDLKGSYYTNLADRQILQSKEAYGKKFIIEIPYNENEWELTNERKMILGYECLKAKKSYFVKNTKGNFENTATAWYSPKIPIGLGPLKFSGLPGLILEIEIDSKMPFTLTANEISQKKEISIKKPTKGKYIKQEDLNAMGIEMRKKQKILMGG